MLCKADIFPIQAIRWLVFGVVRPKLSFRVELNPYSITGMVLIVYAMLIYPVIGMLLGHGYPQYKARTGSCYLC